MSTQIEVRGLSKYYNDRVAVDNLSFSVSQGEVLGFLGPNGAGKSTTMKMLTCFLPPSSGSASVAGFDIYDNPLEVKRNLGYLPENPPVYRDMVVSDYLDFAASIHGVPSTKRKQAVQRAVEKCNLGDVRKRLIGNLSKGYRQRVGIAQAIVHDPQVLILDEPTVGLDPKQIIEIRDLIKSLAGNHTIVLSTHILPEVEATCNRVLIINKGKMVASNTLGQIAMDLRGADSILVKYLGDAKVLESALQGVSGLSPAQIQGSVVDREGLSVTRIKLSGQTKVEAVHEYQAAIAAAAIRSGVKLVELHRDNLSLEQIFVQLTTQG